LVRLSKIEDIRKGVLKSKKSQRYIKKAGHSLIGECSQIMQTITLMTAAKGQKKNVREQFSELRAVDIKSKHYEVILIIYICVWM